MVSIKSKDLLDLKRVGAGNFGTIYKNGDKVYKIYHQMVRTEYDSFCPNPSLKLDKSRIIKYTKLDKKLLYTDLVKDIIYVDGKFGGVVMPYYDGETLLNTLYVAKNDVATNLSLTPNLPARSLHPLPTTPRDNRSPPRSLSSLPSRP